MKALLGVVAVLGAVTVGLGAGVLFVSPAASAMPWVRPAVQVVAVVVALGALGVWLAPLMRSALSRLSPSRLSFARLPMRRRSASASAHASSFTPAYTPSITLSRTDRTPRGVMALASTGTTVPEIARRTGLPVDAVSMLLSISGGAR